MKTIRVTARTAAALMVVTSLNAWSQTGASASATSSALSASATVAASNAVPVPGRKADRALRKRIYAAIGKHKEISAGNISIVAKDGAVTLNGTVADASQVSEVADIVKGVTGVMSVTNKLTVLKPLGGM